MTQHQPYDHALKSLMGDHAAEIIPQLLPDTEVIREQNVEIKRELLHADLVYLVNYRGEAHTLNLELQTNADEDMALRMLRYHVELLIAYRLPVLSVVLYLFEANIPESPFRETSDNAKEELLTLHYQVLTLWTLDAREYVEKRLIVMYTFLSAMKGANASLLIQALEEMKQHYTQPEFVRHASRFRTILNRSNTISMQDKRIVEDYMEYHYDSLLDEDPEVKERVARGKIEALQEMAMEVVNDQYPTLAELAQERVLLIKQPEMLRQLVKQIYKAPDESTARWVLNTFAA
ncbi:MAG: hypothetical protein ACR2H5_26695 [Ktedonobacteraceae bacterium]